MVVRQAVVDVCTFQQTTFMAKRQAQARARQLRKLQRAEELQEVLQELMDRGNPLVYTDGLLAIKESQVG